MSVFKVDRLKKLLEAIGEIGVDFPNDSLLFELEGTVDLDNKNDLRFTTGVRLPEVAAGVTTETYLALVRSAMAQSGLRFRLLLTRYPRDPREEASS